MTWELGSKPGVVDARDALGRPLPVPLPPDQEDPHTMIPLPWPAGEPLRVVFEAPAPSTHWLVPFSIGWAVGSLGMILLVATGWML